MKFYSTKNYYNLPCCHRQHKDEKHCRHLHGYSRSFHFKFACNDLDEKGWVVDFGNLKKVEQFLNDHFDHTCLINQDDPHLSVFQELHERDVIKLVVLPCVSVERTAQFVYEKMNPIILELTDGRCWICEVEVKENDKNSGIYVPNGI